jgi:hypothetical protein
MLDEVAPDVLVSPVVAEVVSAVDEALPVDDSVALTAVPVPVPVVPVPVSPVFDSVVVSAPPSVDVAVDVESALAIPGDVATIKPIPNAAAKAPTRPT